VNWIRGFSSGIGRSIWSTDRESVVARNEASTNPPRLRAISRSLCVMGSASELHTAAQHRAQVTAYIATSTTVCWSFRPMRVGSGTSQLTSPRTAHVPRSQPWVRCFFVQSVVAVQRFRAVTGATMRDRSNALTPPRDRASLARGRVYQGLRSPLRHEQTFAIMAATKSRAGDCQPAARGPSRAIPIRVFAWRPAGAPVP
jgi:hypothetical protein